MKMSFSPHFTVVLPIIIGLIAVVTWLGWVTSQAHAEPPRAISAAMHDVCKDLPRGSPLVENGREQCFDKLYGQGRFRLDTELTGRN